MATITITMEEAALVGIAQDEFGKYAAVGLEFDVSVLPPLRRMQVEHHRWQVTKLTNKADRSTAVMVLGIVEEACWEMFAAVEADDRDEVYDTLGDILIYTCAVCTDLRLDFMTLAKDFDPGNLEQPAGLDGVLNLFKPIGMLAHVIGKHRQLTRGYDSPTKMRLHGGAAISRICAAVQWLAFSNDWEPSVLFQDVLGRVMKRDWTKNTLTGDVAVIEPEGECRACRLAAKGKTVGCLRHDPPLYGYGG